MPDEATRTLEMLGMLYATPTGPDHWPGVLDRISELVGGNGALLFVHDGPEDLDVAAASSRYLPVHIEQYLKSLARDDELRWVHVLDRTPPRTLQDDADIWPEREVYDALPSVRFLRGMNLYHRVAVRPCAHGGWKDALTVLFDDRRGAIRPDEARRLLLLVPHVARAIEFQRPFQLLRRRLGGVLALLDRLGIGLLLLGERGDVALANREAERILDARDGLERQLRSRVGVRDESTATRVRQAVQCAGRAARLEGPARDVRIEVPRAGGHDPYLVDVVPFREDGGELGGTFCGVLLVLVDPEHREMVSIEGLSRSYGLSPTETVVCRGIVQGLTLREIAESRDVSLDTVKSQARAIYGKTGTRSRRELARRALSIVPPLLDADGRRIN